jgi:hypothetical protein
MFKALVALSQSQFSSRHLSPSHERHRRRRVRHSAGPAQPTRGGRSSSSASFTAHSHRATRTGAAIVVEADAAAAAHGRARTHGMECSSTSDCNSDGRKRERSSRSSSIIVDCSCYRRGRCIQPCDCRSRSECVSCAPATTSGRAHGRMHTQDVSANSDGAVLEKRASSLAHFSSCVRAPCRFSCCASIPCPPAASSVRAYWARHQPENEHFESAATAAEDRVMRDGCTCVQRVSCCVCLVFSSSC